jgi:hypothetical protein
MDGSVAVDTNVSILKTNAECSTETLLYNHKTTWHNNREDNNPNSYIVKTE